MTGTTARRVPVGIDARTWATVPFERTVLLVVHNITTLSRLRDVVPLFEGDSRVQVVAAVAETDPFDHGVREALTEFPVLPWPQATQLRFDLIIAASHHGNLADLHGPLLIMSHGIGYTKKSPGGADVFGLSPQWLLYDGRPIATSLVFGHDEEVERLHDAVPQAVPTAVVAGDPCHDRIRASLPFRTHYRNLFGAGPRHRVVVVSSTWGPRSLLGTRPGLLRDLLAESDVDTTRVVAVVHPNIWHGHGPWQVRAWLADCVRAGLVVVPALEGWRAALIAADVVIGDHGAVTCYGAAIGRPVLLGAFPDDDVAKGSPVELLGRLAPRVAHGTSLTPQLDLAISDHGPDWLAPVGALVSSCVDESPARLRAEFYRLLGLPEPGQEPVLARIPDEGATPPAAPTATLVGSSITDRTVRLVRHPADSRVDTGLPTHLAVGLHHPGRLRRSAADVVHARAADLTMPAGELLSTILTTHPGCALAAVTAPGRVIVRTRAGDQAEFTTTSDADPAAWASAVHVWLANGHSLDGDLTVRLGHDTVVLIRDR